MKTFAALCVCAGIFFTSAGAEDSKRAVEWIEIARLEASEGHYPEALAAIDSILIRTPDAFDARLLRARIYAWKGAYAPAEQALAELLAERPTDADARLALASLHFYQGHLDQAGSGFQALLDENPNNQDARDGLNNVKRARAAARSALRPRWRVDAGGEYSVFARRPQPEWNQQYAQLSHRLEDGKTTVHGRMERYSQFDRTDFTVEAGVYRELLPRLRGSFAGGWALDADFRPDWRLAAEAEWLAFPRAGTGGVPGVWALAGGRYDVYAAAEFLGLQPGLRFEWGAPWSLTTKVSHVMEVGGEAVTGWSVRADGSTGSPRLGPARENARLWIGLADAPETLASGATVTTVSTVTVFLGTAVDFDGGWTFNVGYARDDRENSWIRHVYNAGITRNF
jgi:YaiO family outer membrane protein